MNLRILAFLAVLLGLLLAGCSFRAEGENEDDGEGEGGVSVGDGEDDDNEAPSPTVGITVAVLGVALLVRRRMMD